MRLDHLRRAIRVLWGIVAAAVALRAATGGPDDAVPLAVFAACWATFRAVEEGWTASLALVRRPRGGVDSEEE